MLVPARQASDEYGPPYTTFRDAHFRGELDVVKIGRAWFFKRADIEKWIASRTERVSR